MSDGLKDRDWRQLVRSLRQRSCVLLLGPGADVRLPDGPTNLSESLTRQLASELEQEVPSTARLGHIAQQYASSEGRNALESAVLDFLETHRPTVGDDPTFAALAKLPFKLILTTRHDDTIETHLRAEGKSPVVRWYDASEPALGDPEVGTVEAPLVYHLLGHPDKSSSLVLTGEDMVSFLEAVVSGSPGIPHSIRSEFKARGTMYLLVGFGIERWHTRVILSVLGAKESENRSFAVEEFKETKRATDEEALKELSRSMDVEAAHFFREEFMINTISSEADPLLSQLLEKWRAEEDTAGPSESSSNAGSSGPVPQSSGARVFLSYVHEDVEPATSIYESTLR